MKPAIRNIFSFDIDDLPGYTPPDPESFSLQLRVIAGPDSEPGEESFDLTVCTPKWFLDEFTKEDVVVGRHYLIVLEYDYQRILKTIADFCDTSVGRTWTEVAEKLGRLGRWEFEDYQEK